MVGRLLCALLFVPAVLIAEGRPAFTSMTDGTIGVNFPAAILHDDEVKRQLSSGLTTTFAVSAKTGSGARTQARVEIRYDLWDEKYLVRETEFDGARTAASFQSINDLERWWRSTPVRLLRAGSRRSRVDIEVRVLPFSAGESADAREWLARGAGLSQSGTVPQRGDTAPSTHVIDALIGTSLDARPLITFHWRSEVVLPGGP